MAFFKTTNSLQWLNSRSSFFSFFFGGFSMPESSNFSLFTAMKATLLVALTVRDYLIFFLVLNMESEILLLTNLLDAVFSCSKLAVFVVANARVFLENDIIPHVPMGFTKLGDAVENAEVTIFVVLKSQNMDKLSRELDATSDPSSVRYGHHWTIDEVNELTKPSKESVSVVNKWLSLNGVSQIEEGGAKEILKVRLLVGQVQRLLGVRMSVYQSPTGERYVRSMDKYSVPSEVAEHIQVIANINRLPFRPRANDFQGFNRHSLGSSPTEVTPQTIRKLYRIPTPTSASKDGIVQAVVSFLGQYWAPSDLSMFQQWARLFSNPIIKLVGYNNPAPIAAGVEASLDVDYLVGIPEYVPTWVWSTNGTIANDNEPWMVFLDDVVSALRQHPGKNFPSVFSMSYQDLEFTVSRAYAVSVCQLFQKITMTGITFVTGSGDWGVGCNPQQGASCSTFTADFPSSCPYVTSLGGTYVNSNNQEVSVDFSSGGFSNYFTRPAFQNAIVNQYLQNPAIANLLPLLNTSGRAFPDVSTVSTNFQVFAGGFRMPVAGTSAATPTFAAMVTILNRQRAAAGMSHMGWINPFLYASKLKNPSSFTDIVAGDLQMQGCCGASFAAIPGYDAVTGIGSPMFDALSTLALQPSLFREKN
jgi:tripeptidyl-peptidase-1